MTFYAVAVATLLFGHVVGLRPRRIDESAYDDDRGVNVVDADTKKLSVVVANNATFKNASDDRVIDHVAKISPIYFAVGSMPDGLPDGLPGAPGGQSGAALRGVFTGEDGPVVSQAQRSQARRIGYGRNEVEDLSFKEILVALGDGSGFNSDRTMRARTVLRYQHLAASMLIMLIFCGFLCISLSMVHWQVQAQVHQLGAVKYYAHLGNELASVDGEGLQGFLETFDRDPTESCLVVTGWEPREEDDSDDWFYDHRFLKWQGQCYHLAFSFALDVKPWLEPPCLLEGDSSDDEPAMQGRLQCQLQQQQGESRLQGLSVDDQLRLLNFLRRDSNGLGTVEIQKEMDWPGWEEVATNIRMYLRQQGFNGLVQVGCKGSESVTIHKNNAWAHFMRSRATRIIAALSIFGWVFYEIYMWLRMSKLVVRSKHRVDVPVDQFWELVGDSLTAQGFVPPGESGQRSLLPASSLTAIDRHLRHNWRR